MSKRELEGLDFANDADGLRTKRRREIAGAAFPEVDIIQSDPAIPGIEDSSQDDGITRELVQEQGLKLWQIVRDAANKEGRTLSLDFLRRPSKRQYPDYYQLIQQPIALDEIKKRLDNGGYLTLETVRQDFELCFSNAKQYNMKDSPIWKDAKELLKLMNKTCTKITSIDEDGENADGDGKGKSKTPSLTRLIKSRLQKLVDKTDDSGRVLSTAFMELPSKKDWPTYYKEIKRPQCLENIFKRIKRKEYYNTGEFAADVELVFANAIAFNQDHTPIWEDARTLRDFFRNLMSDMPAPYSLTEYTKPSNGKIKIKMPAGAQQITSSSVPVVQTSASSPLLLRVPISNQTRVSPTSTPVPNNISLPVATATPSPVPPVALPPSQTVHAPTVSKQSIPYITPTPSHYLSTSLHPAASSTSTVPPASHVSSNTVSDAILQPYSVSNSPAPSSHPHNPLKSVSMKIQSSGRCLDLDYRDGVKCWSMRLLSGETEVHIDQVVFLGDEEEEESSGEEEHDEEEEEKHDVEGEQIEDVPSRTNRKKGKGKGRGRLKAMKAGIAKVKGAATKKKKQKPGPIQVKLNGTVVKEEDNMSKWIVHPSVGMNSLEVGESGGLIWKVYVQRGES